MRGIKAIGLLLVVVLASGLCGCGEVIEAIEPTLLFRGVELSLGVSEQDVLPILGEDYTCVETDSCAGLGKDRLYTYPSARLYFFESESGETSLTSISYTDDGVLTADGLYIGCQAEQVLALRGEPTEQGADYLIYRAQTSQLRFTLRDGRVTGIALMAAQE